MKKKCIRPEKSDWRSEEVEEARPFCNTCIRPKRVCLCKYITVENNSCSIGILQHPNEVGKTFNTAKVAQLSLENSFLYEGVNFDEHNAFQKTLNSFSDSKVGILYPSSKAKDLSLAPHDLECLIVLDGTWPEAKQILKRNSTLQSLPHYAFTPKQISNYILRKEPKVNYVCSLEAIVESLRIIERNETGFTSLLTTLQKMIDIQEALRHTNSRHKSSSEFAEIKREIKKINKALYSQNVEKVDIVALQIKLKVLENKLLE